MNLRFEWDPNKAANNKAKHGITFEQAITAFDDPEAVEFYDAFHSEDEKRYKLIGLSDSGILMVVYTLRDAGRAYRIISARKASRRERRDYDKQKRKN